VIDMDGILNIDKPQGWTSHDVVAWVRRLLRVKRVGHAGTLDPLATGVLLVCVGQATRLSEYVMASDKSYRAQVQLGTSTDTYDLDGDVVQVRPLPEGLDLENIREALAAFQGDLMQTPPVYSAIKQGGVALHRLARRGEAVQPQARPVHIHHIELVDWSPPVVTVNVTCSPGTYIRSLAHDLGEALGCGGTLASLRRTRSGAFSVDTALAPDDIAEAFRSGSLNEHLKPMTAALTSLTPVEVTEADAARLRTGGPIPHSSDQPPTSTTAYAIDASGGVVAILRYASEQNDWWPDKVFLAAT